MKRGIIVILAATAASSCGGTSDIAVRALPTPLAAGQRSVSFRVAEANGQFALGNVALALESYRKALREDANSVDAMVGLAACYDAMGRFDLSRRQYEAALAIEPANRDLLNRLAASLLQQGRAGEAVAIRQEVASRTPAPGSATPLVDATVATLPVVPAKPAPAPVPHPAPAPAILPKLVVAVVSAPPEMAIAPIGASVTLALPVARQVNAVTVPLVTARAPVAVPVKLSLVADAGPRLERLSLGEVALVTSRTAPRALASRESFPTFAAKSAVSALAPRMAVHSLAPPKPVMASFRPTRSPLLLLNAARSQGLAARTRRYLKGEGFGDALLGDAPRIRATTLIITPVADRQRARRLARAMGLAPRFVTGKRLVMILGRDSIARRTRAA